MSSYVTRVGVVGLGPWGLNHVRTCAELKILAAFYDPDKARLAEAAALNLEASACSSFEELLETVDAVIVAAPAQLHGTLALRVIQAGKHVLIEKPFALDLAAAEQIEKSARSAGVCAAVGHVLLYHPGIRAARDLILSGAIGRLTHIRSRRSNLGRIREIENVWWSFAPHDVAVACATFKESPSSVSAALLATRNGPADFAYADLAFGIGRSAHIEATWLDPTRTAQIDFFGSDGVIVFEDSGGARLTLYPCGAAPTGVTTWRGPSKPVSFSSELPLRAELVAFVEAIEGRQSLINDAAHGVEVVRVLAACESAASETSRNFVTV